ncbi:MAG: Lrp/AsnC ligand binding domain-containing protein, partial [Bacteroidota bacterium]
TEIQEIHHVSGDSDFLLKVLLEDISTYNEFILNKLGLVDNIANVRSQFALSTRREHAIIELD